MVQYHPTKNLKPQTQLKRRDKAWWIGECGHEWEMVYDSIINGQNCPACAGKRIIPGFNDLATLNSQVAEQWHPTKNGNLTAQQVTVKSSKKVWWLGSCGHEYEAKIANRTGLKSNCPVCSGRTVLPGFNDLATLNPQVAAQWHPTKNGDLTAQQVTVGSAKNVWWLGECGHEWEDSLSHRKQGRTCPQCSYHNYSSNPENEIYEHILTYYPKASKNTRKIIHPYEIDIYIPETQTAIEFNGLYWHNENAGKDKNYHMNKWSKCKEKGIQLIQIWEDDWNRKPELVKQTINQQLNRLKAPLEQLTDDGFLPLTQNEADSFLLDHHLNGSVKGEIRIGLTEKIIGSDQKTKIHTVAVAERDSSNNYVTIKRYATSKSTLTNFAQILKYIEVVYAPFKITIFSDNCFENGKLYQEHRFQLKNDIPADYTYLHKRKRVAKETLTTEEKNKSPKIWDAGKVKWEKLYIDPLTP